ncbi:quinate permease [Acaromyces ingoldii]|uniref:Quinate permease n=1 Tax=Acaromyces ingoldii TaxID=215250 RepID=A0A316YFK4_9BASI|nr:quinate permease [Acaromyces ingoldii]PWN87989.1 quinate permease [Acaromyces ingoldii]
MAISHLDEPREVWNWRVKCAVFVIGILGASRGADEGIISGIESNKEWLRTYGIQDGSAAQSNVVSMVQIGCVLGALLAFFVVDHLGRLRTSQVCILFWLAGITIWITSYRGGASGLAQVYAGRFVAGTGIGGTAVCVPTFLSEIAPKSRRGLAVNVYAASVYLGILIGYFANYGCQVHVPAESAKRWMVPVSINYLFGGTTLIGSLFLRESPRWLLRRGHTKRAQSVLQYYRRLDLSHPYLVEEWKGMEREAETLAQQTRLRSIIALLTDGSQLYRLCAIGIAIQILSNWSGGGGSLTIYAPRLLALVGVHSNSTLFTTGILGVVKLLSALTATFFLIDRLGRKRSVFIGITLQGIAAVYLAAFLGATDLSSATLTGSEQRGSIAAIVAIFVAGIGWTFGFNAISYLIGTEIFPLSTRAMASSIIMVFHFVNQYGASRALQPMLHTMQGYGLFTFNAVVCFFSIAYIALFIPETAGRSLEEMNSLFEGPWYRIGMLGSSLPASSSQHPRSHLVPVSELEQGNGPDSADKKSTLSVAEIKTCDA